MKEKILITGFNGEIGSKTLKELVKRGKSVIAMDITDAKEKIDSVSYINDSILNFELINQIFENNNITEVYHFAALLSQTAYRNPELAHEINEKASRNLIDCAYLHGANNHKLIKFFFLSIRPQMASLTIEKYLILSIFFISFSFNI